MSNLPTRRHFLAGAAALTAAQYSRVLGANDRAGVGFIGYGLMAKGHVATFRKLPDVSLVALAEVHRGRLAEGLKAMGGDPVGYADFRKLLDDKRVDAVVIATPDHWHALMTMLACAAGKDVYVEKPLTLFVREGRWMIDVAARHKRIIQCGTQQRSGKHYQRARELIRDGKIGRVVSVRITNVRNVTPGFGSPPDQDPPADLDWDAWLGPAPAHKYNPNRALYHFRWFWDHSGGQMTNLGAHQLDIIDWVFGLQSLKSVTSIGGRFALTDNGETPDTQDALFALDRCTVAASIRECAVGPKPEYPLEFVGTKGTLGITRSGFAIKPDSDIAPANQVVGVKEGHPAGGPKPVDVSGQAKLRTDAIVDRSGSSAEQYLEHARNFLDCIRSRKAPVSELESGHRVASACHLANLSLRLGRSLCWDAKAETIPGDAEAARQLVRPYRSPWDKELKALGVSES
ncbi:MAG TPA: Gfo/Idh/MocA family oxidoreductase [Gemmataceae bacterium]|nr:Gfo/Idh/MocA family oxidoreductase [Gemmataceae bacterium]